MVAKLLEVDKDWLEGKHPQIRLSGDWLQKLGFRVGSTVLVEMEKGHLTLKPVVLEKP
ncbi:MAG: type I toxin-antitoxin system SymE family toxin [Clostridia bacterium]|nr:type I toxin-antitoxin system SymE family toxin [Clostridia bacterium]